MSSFKKKKVLAKTLQSRPERTGKAGQRRRQRGKVRGWRGNSVPFSSPPFRSHSDPAERLLLKTQPPDIGLRESSPVVGCLHVQFSQRS